MDGDAGWHLHFENLTKQRVLKLHTIMLGSIEVTVTKKKIKTLRVTVHPPDGRVRISSPLRASDEYIKNFALSKMGWIEKQQKKFQLQPRPPLHRYVSGESHFFHGEPHILDVRYEDKKPGVLINGDILVLCVRPGSSMEKRIKTLNEWYRSDLKKQIPLLIEKWALIVKDVPLEWGVKNMKTRWGSCNTGAKRIWLSLRLAEKSVSCLEYVVVHEMVHLLERRHGKPFVAHMDRILPDWRNIRDNLNSTPHDNWIF